MNLLHSPQMGYSDCDGAVPVYTATEVKRMIGMKVTYEICDNVERRTTDVSD